MFKLRGNIVEVRQPDEQGVQPPYRQSAVLSRHVDHALEPHLQSLRRERLKEKGKPSIVIIGEVMPSSYN